MSYRAHRLFLPYLAVVKNRKIWFCDLDLWPMTLKFSGFRTVVKIHVAAKFHQAACSRSWVIVVAEKKNSDEKIFNTVVTTARTVIRWLVTYDVAQCRHDVFGGGEARQTLVEDKYPQRITGSDDDVHSQIKLEPVDKKRLTDGQHAHTHAICCILLYFVIQWQQKKTTTNKETRSTRKHPPHQSSPHQLTFSLATAPF